jgi:hypothetical protein
MTALLLAAVIALAVPFWGARDSLPAETPPESLHPGQFVWNPDVAESGPVTMIVSLDEQRAYVYRNGLRIAYTTVSTGRKGYATPTGVFTILQKDRDHHSDKYNDAAMPYQERLTWDGVALHAGGLPGYPSSHGCVHLPSQFAADLFAITPMGMTVVVVGGPSAPAEVDHPTDFAPIDPRTGIDDEEPRLLPNQEFRWEPDKSPSGPVSILISSADQRVIVFRNGLEIGRSRITLRDPEKPLGTHAFVVAEKSDPNAPRPRWIGVAMPGYQDSRGRTPTNEAAARVVLPDEFRVAVQPLLVPGTTVLITDATVLPETTGTRLQIANSDPPP